MPQDLPSPGRNETRREFVLTGRHVLAIFIGFFAIVASVNAYMMRQAISTMPGIDARNGYDASQRFNSRIAAANEQDARGWKADAELRQEPAGLSANLDIRAPAGVQAQPLAVSLRLEHPSTRALDRSVALDEAAPGHYVGTLPGRFQGGWTVVIEARAVETGELLYASRNRTHFKG